MGRGRAGRKVHGSVNLVLLSTGQAAKTIETITRQVGDTGQRDRQREQTDGDNVCKRDRERETEMTEPLICHQWQQQQVAFNMLVKPQSVFSV